VELGHYQAQRAGQVDLLLSLTILDVFSRYVPGRLIAECESASLAKQLIAESCAKQGIERDQLTLHADRGSAMTSKTVAQFLADLRRDQNALLSLCLE